MSAVKVKSVLNGQESQIKFLRPLHDQLLVQMDRGGKMFGSIYLPDVGNGFDIKTGTVMAVGLKAKVRTRFRNVLAGDRILFVRVVNKAVEDVDIRSEDGGQLSFLQATHALAVLTDSEILPINEVSLVEAPSGRKTFGSIELVGADSLKIHASRVIAIGPDVDMYEPGEYALHNSINGVLLDSFEIKKQFGSGLKLIKQVSVIGAGNTGQVEGQSFAETVKTTHQAERL